jgi:acetoin utilization deacetylase AcuC-like enzyme
MIVDWDLHHGNGIQSIFYDDPKVLYFSLHRYPYFPWTGGAEEVGEGKGEGYNVNVPLEFGCSDTDYANIFRHLLLPIARCYRPEIILVAAGFDTHYGDPLRSMTVTEKGFARMTHLLMELTRELCQSRLVLALEGGYNADALRDSVAAVLLELNGRSSLPAGKVQQSEDNQLQKIEKTIEQVRAIHKKYWKDL